MRIAAASAPRLAGNWIVIRDLNPRFGIAECPVLARLRRGAMVKFASCSPACTGTKNALGGVNIALKSEYASLLRQAGYPRRLRKAFRMAGHSKWANIKHKKAASDAKRGKIWTRLIKEITVAARLGGGDIASNPRLRLAVDKAADANMPKDNVTRAIQRGTGGLEGANYEEIRYEGYGINGAAIIVDCMTDNRVRTVAEVRHAFSKFGGNMGTEGSVAFLFKHCGQLMFAPGTNEDALMEAALEAGAEDVIADDEGGFEVITDPYQFSTIRETLETAGFKPELAEVTMKPSTSAEFTGDDGVKMQKLLDALENLDDVQEVYTNAVIND
jgi:YebC/PmpR family DNA-binding regulatory protein